MYVDDVILTGSDSAAIQSLKDYLHQEFSIKDLGQLSVFLGIEVTHLPTSIFFNQKKFTHKLLDIFSMDLSRKASTPLPLKTKLSADKGDLISDPELFRSFVGELNFLTNTRPHLVYAIQSLRQFM